jgi:uncharacterized protein YggT (Ycf19 family)
MTTYEYYGTMQLGRYLYRGTDRVLYPFRRTIERVWDEFDEFNFLKDVS